MRRLLVILLGSVGLLGLLALVRPRPTVSRLEATPGGSPPPRPAPAEGHTPSDEKTVARAIRYTRTREALFVADLLWGWLVQSLFLTTGGSARLRDLARRLAPRPWAVEPIFSLLYGLVTLVLNLPLAYVRGYVVEHRYGLSTQTHRAWLADLGKGAALGLALEAPLSAVSYAVIRRSPRWWWLILSALVLPFTVLLAQLYPVLIAPIFNKFVPLPDTALVGRIRTLAARAGVRVAEVTQMDMSRQTRKANAFFAGLGPTKRIALGDTLVSEFTPDEIEVIVAHELAHQVHRDIWKGVSLGAVATLGSAFALSRLAEPVIRRFGGRLGFERLDDIASMPLLGLLVSVLSILAMPLANGFSRAFVERPADRYALEMTNRPAAFISGMEKLTRLNLIDPNPPALVKYLLYSHPPVGERIALARAYAEQAGAGRAET